MVTILMFAVVQGAAVWNERWAEEAEVSKEAEEPEILWGETDENSEKPTAEETADMQDEKTADTADKELADTESKEPADTENLSLIHI